MINWLAISGSTATLTWFAVPGVTYRVQYKEHLSDPAWETLGADITATDSAASADDTAFGGTQQRFYRTLVVP